MLSGKEMQAPVYVTSLEASITPWPSQKVTWGNGETDMTLNKISRVLFSI